MFIIVSDQPPMREYFVGVFVWLECIFYSNAASIKPSGIVSYEDYVFLPLETLL